MPLPSENSNFSTGYGSKTPRYNKVECTKFAMNAFVVTETLSMRYLASAKMQAHAVRL